MRFAWARGAARVASAALTSRRCARVVCAFAWLLVAGSAKAQTPERVAVFLPECRESAVWQRDLLELLRVELQVEQALQIETGAGPAVAERVRALWVARECAAPSGGPLQLRASNPQDGSVLERTLSLQDVPVELRSRVVALALAELLRASSRSSEDGQTLPPSAAASAQRPETTPARSDDPPVPGDASAGAAESARGQPTLAAGGRVDSHTIPTHTASSSPSERFSIALGPALHVSLRGAPVLYGAELSLRWWRLSIGALGYLGNVGDALGDIAIKRLHGFATFEVLRAEHGAWTWAAAVRGAAGGTYASAHASATALSTGSTDFSYDGSLETSLSLRFARAWAVHVRANIGLAYAPAYRADDRVIADYSGLFTGISLSLAR